MIKYLMMLCCVATLGYGGETFTVQVTRVSGTGENPYVEYTVNGRRTYRTDTAGSRCNCIAWEHMSDADRQKTLDAYGWGLNDRREDFGVDGAQKLADQANKNQHWTELWQAYQDKLVKGSFPTHAAIFEEETTRDAYFAANYEPAWSGDDQPTWDDEMTMMHNEQLLIWSWAYESYLAVKRANERKIETAVKAISGDLIALITDKVLVPNITVANPVELGFQYGFRKDIIGTLLDYANSITAASDQLVERVIGERASGASGAELIGKATDLINMNLHMINLCRTKLAALKTEIEARGNRQLAAARTQTATIEKETEAVETARAAQPVTGYPVDATIADENERQETAIDALASKADKTEAEEERLQQLREAKIAYNQRLFDDLSAALETWASDCLAACDAWEYADDPRASLEVPEISGEATSLLFGHADVPLDSDASVITEANTFIAYWQ